jgi:transcription elongation factor GreB
MRAVSKAFVREAEPDEPALPDAEPALPSGRNYMSPAGYARLKAELKALVEVERPKVVQVVSWAASNGDRSENGDYIYGKKRLREIDRRVRFLIHRLKNADVVDSAGRDSDQVFFGATVSVASAPGGERSYTIVGIEEADPGRGRVSWISPIARALFKARPGDTVHLRSPGGVETLEVLDVRYDPID